MTLAIIMSGLALLISGITCTAVLVLLGRKEFHYATRGDLIKMDLQIADISRRQSQLWRYVEAVDEQSGGLGHQVLGRAVQLEDAEA